MKKKLLFIGLPLLLIIVIGGVLYWHHITSPEYSLAKIKESITNHDITTFEKYVDVDGIIMRMMSQIPQVIGADKKLGLFGKDVDQLILNALQGPIINIAKESVRTVIERGYFDEQVTQTDSISKLVKQFPIDSFKIMSLKKIRKAGKICRVPLQIYVEAYEGETTLELMMRDKGSYWQVAEISNLPKVMYDVAQLQKTYRYRNRYAAVLYMANSIKGPFPKTLALAKIATELEKGGKVEEADRVFSQAIETANSIKDAESKAKVLGAIAKELAGAGNRKKAEVVFSKAIETTNSINDAESKARVLGAIAEKLGSAGKFEKAIETANSIKNKSSKAHALWAIAWELGSAGKFEKAIETTNLTKGKHVFKAWALAARAKALASAGNNEKAEVVFLNAIETANSIKDADGKARALFWARALRAIAWELASAGKFEKAIETANSIKDPSDKIWALEEIAKELARAGKIKEAIQTANSIKYAGGKARALGVIAKDLAKAGKIEEADRVFSQAIETANSIKNKYSKAWALGKIAEELAGAGKIEKVIETVNSIEASKDYALVSVLGGLAKLRIKDEAEDARVANLIMTALNQ